MPSDFFKISRCSKSLAFSWRKRRFSASSSSKLRFGCRRLGALRHAFRVRPTIEQRRADPQLGRYLGCTASTGTPQLQRLLLY